MLYKKFGFNLPEKMVHFIFLMACSLLEMNYFVIISLHKLLLLLLSPSLLSPPYSTKSCSYRVFPHSYNSTMKVTKSEGISQVYGYNIMSQVTNSKHYNKICAQTKSIFKYQWIRSEKDRAILYVNSFLCVRTVKKMLWDNVYNANHYQA